MAYDLTLSSELTDQVVFGMENQENRFCLDLQTRAIVEEEPGVTDEDEDRFVPLPEWRSVDGYNIMSGFVATLRNPIYRERLRAILASGRGVFRQFKDALGERPDIERLWHDYKQRAMRAIVTEWMNDLRELRGLERLELSEDEETDALVGSDFTFTPDDGSEAGAVLEALRAAFEENHRGTRSETLNALYRYRTGSFPDPADASCTIIVAQTPAAEPAAHLWAFDLPGGGPPVSVVALIYVQPEYRGLGLAHGLLQHHMRACEERGCADVIVEMTGSGCDLAGALSARGFTTCGESMRLSR